MNFDIKQVDERKLISQSLSQKLNDQVDCAAVGHDT